MPSMSGSRTIPNVSSSQDMPQSSVQGGGYAPLTAPLSPPRQGRSNLLTVQEEDGRSLAPSGLSRLNSNATSETWRTIGSHIPEFGIPMEVDGASFASAQAPGLAPFNERDGPPAAGLGRRDGVLMHTNSVASGVSGFSGVSMATVRGSDLLQWKPIFDAEKLRITGSEIDSYDMWLTAGDMIAFGSSSSDNIILYDGANPMLTLTLPCDQWQLTPDGWHILYTQGQSINVYSLRLRRIILTERFTVPWVTSCRTAKGILLASTSGDLHIWVPTEPRIRALSGAPTRTTAQLQWTKCNGTLDGNWACVFSHSPGRHAPHIKVHNMQGDEPIMIKGIAAQVAKVLINGVRREVIVSLDRVDADKTKLKMSCRRLDYSDDTPLELFSPPITIDLPPECAQFGLSFHLLVDPELSIIIVLLAAPDSADATAKIYDLPTGRPIGDTEESVVGNLAEMRTDSWGHVLKRSLGGIIQRLDIDRTRLSAHRAMPAAAVAASFDRGRRQ